MPVSILRDIAAPVRDPCFLRHSSFAPLYQTSTSISLCESIPFTLPCLSRPLSEAPITTIRKTEETTTGKARGAKDYCDNSPGTNESEFTLKPKEAKQGVSLNSFLCINGLVPRLDPPRAGRDDHEYTEILGCHTDCFGIIRDDARS